MNAIIDISREQQYLHGIAPENQNKPTSAIYKTFTRPQSIETAHPWSTLSNASTASSLSTSPLTNEVTPFSANPTEKHQKLADQNDIDQDDLARELALLQ